MSVAGLAGTSVNAEPVFFHAQCLLGTREYSDRVIQHQQLLTENPPK
jgi:hypothetical protein